MKNQGEIMKLKKLIIAVSAVLISVFSIHSKTSESISLTRKLKTQDYYQECIDDPTNYAYDGFLDAVFLDGTYADYDGDVIVFDGLTSDDYGNLKFHCTFDMETMIFTNEYVYLYETYDETVNGYITDKGKLNGKLEYFNETTFEDEIYYIEDYKDFTNLEALLQENIHMETHTYETIGIGLVSCVIAALVSIYVVVSEYAEQNKSESNFQYNKGLEDSSIGMSFKNCITNQRESKQNGYKSGKYKFGFTLFEDVGCEVAAVYNLLIKIKQPEYLSKVIYDFEKWNIEIAVGWGKLGSNPLEICSVLHNKNICHMVCRGENGLNYLNQIIGYFNSANLIISSWNADCLGLHTYYLNKNIDIEGEFATYNFNENGEIEKYHSINGMLDGTGAYIVGYLVNAV